ncbi:hypothetical protein L0F63_005733, partial [Massospora cicadina]
ELLVDWVLVLLPGFDHLILKSRWFSYRNKLYPRFYSQRKGAEPRKDTIVKLLENIRSRQDAKRYLEHFTDTGEKRFAIIKVGGAVLTDYLDTLASSLKFLHEAGLYPIVVHGAGPQLNKLLTEANIEPRYHEGIRITDGTTLEIVRSVFQQENLKLVEALEEQARAPDPLTAAYLSQSTLTRSNTGLSARSSAIDSCTAIGAMPILTSLAETKEGQILNVNADVAASILARVIQPLKVVYLNEKDGIMHGESGEKIDVIDLTHDYAELARQPWFRYGTKLKINQIKELLEGLPKSSSVSVISPAHLTRELITVSGGGTLIRRGIDIHIRKLTNDERALITCINSKTRIDASRYLKSIHGEATVYHDDGYSMVAVLSPLPQFDVPYLGCLPPERESKLVWNVTEQVEDIDWHFCRSEGGFTLGAHTIFWYGLTREEASDLIMRLDASHLAPTKAVQVVGPRPLGVRPYSTLASPRFSQGRVGSIGARGQIGARSYSISASPRSSQVRVGLIGARGHTGQELVQLINDHPNMKLTHISSRELCGKELKPYTKEKIHYELIPAETIGQISDVDAWILALPNGVAKTYVDALDRNTGMVILDLSADYRFDASGRWWYGLPELYPFSGQAASSRPAVTRISNPGCYATGCQVGLKPLLDAIIGQGLQLPGRPVVFGISGFSGAGTTPSPKNDPEILRDNLIPYALSGHIHEGEASRHLKAPIYFTPHVASFFRGITLTITVPLPAASKFTSQSLFDLYAATYAPHGLIRVQRDIPLVKDNQNRHGVHVGGFAVAEDGSRAVLVATLDNLLKGAATQAIQNLNLAFGLPGLTGIPPFK